VTAKNLSRNTVKKMKSKLLLLLSVIGLFMGSVAYATESTVVAVGGDAGETPGEVMTVTHTGSTPSAATLKVSTSIIGNLIFSTAGNGVQIKEGTNARMGRSTLASGQKIVSNNTITSNTRFILSHSSTFGTLGHLYISSQNSIYFIIKSSSATDESVVDWILIEAQ
jgi:hypothetical protein